MDFELKHSKSAERGLVWPKGVSAVKVSHDQVWTSMDRSKELKGAYVWRFNDGF